MCTRICIRSRNFFKISSRPHSRKSDCKIDIFENIHHVIISKYTLECTQFNHILKINIFNITHYTTTQAGCFAMFRSHCLKNYTRMFKDGFLPLIKKTFILASPLTNNENRANVYAEFVHRLINC